MNLSEHFTLEEFTFSDTATRLGIDNTPDDDQVQKLTYLASCLEVVRDLIGPMHINSGYRCEELNAAVGSKPTSQHLKCEAADCRSLAGLSPIEMCRRVVDSDIQFDQIIFEFGSWMHISFTDNPRRSILTIDKRGTQRGLVEV